MVFRIMLQFEARYNSERTAQEFTHNPLLCEINLLILWQILH